VDCDVAAQTVPLEIKELSWGIPGALEAGEPPIIEGLNLRVEPGSWVTLTGPSGVGKTTMLSLCAGLLRPDSGEVRLFEHSLRDLSDSQISELRATKLGLIFQNYHLDDSRTTLENILLPGYFGKLNWRRLTETAVELAEQLGLTEQLSKSVSVLSGGQRQRVALARALIVSPELVLADEPTGALDDETAQIVLNILSQRVNGGMSVLSVTHDRLVLDRSDVQYRLVGGALERRGE
jgi:putative ABC transport system ATP-binding protein